MGHKITIVHISDIHLNPVSKKDIFGMGIDTLSKFLALFDDVKEKNIHPDCFIISGDLIHEGTEDDYEYLHKVVQQKQQEFGVPVFVCLGNHDTREAFWAGYKGARNKNSEYYYSAVVQGLRLIFLDSKSGTDEEGVISEKQLDWLGQELMEPGPKGTLVIVHHPLFCKNLDYMKYSILQNTDQLLPVLQGTDVLAVLSGHIHFNAVFNLSGLMNSVIAAASYGIDCSDVHLHKFMDDSSYGIVTIEDQSVMVQQRSMPNTKNVKYELPIRQLEN